MIEENIVDTGDPASFKKRKKKAQLEEERYLEELRQLLATAGNRHFIWKLLCQCGVYQTNSDPEPTMMAFKEGRRSVGLWLLAEMLRARPDAYAVMRDEATERERLTA